MPKKIIISLLAFTVLVAGLVVGIILVRQQQELRKKAAPATTLSILPPSKTIDVGETVNLTVNIDTAENVVTAAELYITFDPRKLTMTKFTPGPFLPVELTSPQINNTIGSASATFGAQVTEPRKGQGTLATLTFQAKTTGEATVNFGPQTKAAAVDETTNIVISKNPSTLTILAGSGLNQPIPTSTPTPTPAGGPTLTPTPTTTPIGGTDELPQAGTSLPIIVSIGAGIILLTAGLLLAL